MNILSMLFLLSDPFYDYYIYIFLVSMFYMLTLLLSMSCVLCYRVQKFATIICLKLVLYLADMWSQMTFSGLKTVLHKLQSPFYCLWLALLFAALPMPMHSIDLRFWC